MDLEAKLDRLSKMNSAISSLVLDIKIDGSFEDFKNEIERIDDETWMLTYLTALGIGKVCQEQKIKPYSFVGGFAVYGEIFKRYGIQPHLWRGSSDIDIVAEKDLVPILRDNFADVPKFNEFSEGIVRWHITLDKRTMDDDLEYEPIKTAVPLDLWLPGQTDHYFCELVDEQFWKRTEQANMKNINFIIAAVPQLIRLKNQVDKYRPKDFADLYALLHIAEKEGIKADLSPDKARVLLERYDEPRKAQAMPSKEYLSRLT